MHCRLQDTAVSAQYSSLMIIINKDRLKWIENKMIVLSWQANQHYYDGIYTWNFYFVCLFIFFRRMWDYERSLSDTWELVLRLVLLVYLFIDPQQVKPFRHSDSPFFRPCQLCLSWRVCPVFWRLDNRDLCCCKRVVTLKVGLRGSMTNINLHWKCLHLPLIVVT